MQLFFHPDLDSDFIQLSREESLHAVKSLRMRSGDSLSITDGKGTLAEGTIFAADTSSCTVQILKRTYHEHRADYNLHLAVAPTKNADRIEWLVEKAVEIGIDEITPLLTHNTERTHLNRERLEKIAISAMKQSLHTHLPVIHHETQYDAFLNQVSSAVKMICHGHYDHPLSITQACQPKHDAVVIIGPEGDFTDDEISLAGRCGFLPVTLGSSRLRTETAALMAVCAVSIINQTQFSEQ